MSKAPLITSLRRYLVGIIVSLLTVLLLYIAKDYPCLRGSGLAMADSEAFLVSVFIALPSFAWALWKIVHQWRHRVKDKSVMYLAIFALTGATIFLAFAIPLIFFTSKFPIRFICEQPLLQWIFAFPM